MGTLLRLRWLFALPPREDDNTTTTSSNQYIYSFGGDTQSDADNRGGAVRTNWRYDLSSQGGCWEQLANGPTEIGYRATATQVASQPDAVYVIAGADGNRVATQDVYRYSLPQDTWALLTTPTSGGTASDGPRPAPRWKHAAVALDESRILVTGGRQGGTVHADVWVLDTATLTWTEIGTRGSMPPVYRHGLG